ncbi:MAG: hypothetical protein HY019_04515 [Aquabacterium sp.]|uniref:hypothetical protein n=1 Tax=Aquabacterium sp. TaxID=1872578 RepID=UPI0025C5FE43|nr:hypothetical protein [Aquabacterium sp.]MBI3381252.1 hypothetical protein [Aquabacterium sp.]
MKKLVLVLVAAVPGFAVHAQGYVGAVAALTSIGGGCPSGNTECDKKGFGLHLYAGSTLSKAKQIDFGVGRLESVEVGLMTFGKGDSNGVKQIPIPYDTATTEVPTSAVATANALTFAAVSRVPLMDGVAIGIKTGIAFVSSTMRYSIGGVQDGSETASKLKPYLALTVEYAPMSNLKIVWSYDWTRFDVAGQKGSLGALGLGAEVGF